MKTRAPELSALIIILRSTGPVISQRRSRRSAGASATRHSASRTSFVLGQEARQAARVELALPLVPPLEQLAAPGIQLAVQARDELERLAREDFLVGRGKDLHVGERAHAGSFVNCASSVEPLSASVSLSGATACVTRSK